MNGVELLEQVYVRREAGEATACQTCVSKCLSDKLDSGDKATDQDQAICFSECGCSKEGTELDDDGMNLWWDSRPSDRERTRKLRNAGVTNYPSKGAPDHGFIRRFDALPEDVKKALRKSVESKGTEKLDDSQLSRIIRWMKLVADQENSGQYFTSLATRAATKFGITTQQADNIWDSDGAEEVRATEQDIISICKECGFVGGMKDIIKHTDATGHTDIELMGATKEVLLIEQTLGENCGCKFNKFAGESVKRLEKTHGKEVAFMFGKIEGIEGMKIKGKLAYAGVSHNNRLYLPEALQQGDRMELPMIFNHASPDGAEFELSRLPQEIRESILNHEHIRVGDVKLFWDAEKLTLFYEGEVNDEFFAKEIDQGLMSVSLGMLFDADSPEICDQECYTVVKGAEFTEVSLVYHPGFPIATIESNEIRLKKRITPRRYKL